MGINLDKPQKWKQDIKRSVDMYNDWFMNFAPEAFRNTRVKTTDDVLNTLSKTDYYRNISPQLLADNPEILATLRMSTCPPIAIDRIIGLAGVNANLVKQIENNNIEFERQSLQNALDLQKTQDERKALGQFSTPKPLADAIVKASLAYINGKIRFLDTSIGTGVFFSSLLDCSDKKNISCACGYEIDSYYALPSIKLWEDENINYIVGDFFEAVPPQKDEEKFNVIISNPPYIRHHYIANAVKKKLNERIKETFGLSFSGLTGLYGYFMALSSLWLQNNGISAWLVPNEFLDVNYGREIKTFLLSRTKLLRIHRFNPLKVQFSDALVTSTVVFYSTGQTSDAVLFTTGNDLNKPDSQKLVLYKI